MILTWPIAFTIVGITIAFLSFLYRMLHKDITLDDVKRYNELNTKYDEIKTNTQDNKKDIESIEKDVGKVENNVKDLLDKLIDLIKTTK